MSSDHHKTFQALEEIVKFKKLLVDVNPDLNQTLNQLFQHEKDIYSSLLVKSPEEKKLPDIHNNNITTIENKPLVPEVNLPPQQKFCAYFSFKDVTLRDNVKKFLPEDVVYLNSLDERDVDQNIVLLGLNAERMIPDDLKSQINKMSINGKTLHMITFCPKGLHASDRIIDIGEKKVEVYVFAFDREYKCMPRDDHKTIIQILEKAGYKKPNKVQAKPEEKSLQDKFIKTQPTSETESKKTEQIEVNNKADIGNEYSKQRNINGLSGKEFLYNNKIEQKSKFEDESRRSGHGDSQRKYDKKIENMDNGQDSSKKKSGGGLFGLFS